jgi:diguanylate cyclase (GGDEF)-like protein
MRGRFIVHDLQNTILNMVESGLPLPVMLKEIRDEVQRAFPGVLCSIEPHVPGCECEFAVLDNGARDRPIALCSVAANGRSNRGSVARNFATEASNLRAEGDRGFGEVSNKPDCSDVKACWSRPVLGAHGHTVATIWLFYRDQRLPSQAERELVDRCVHLCAMALNQDRRLLDHERRADIDTLTGLPDRIAFNVSLDERACNLPGSWALCIVDLDNVKFVNDTFGYRTGDILLQQAADRLVKAAHPDIVYRIGGDEYAVIIEHAENLYNLDSTVNGYLNALGRPMDCGGNVISPRATIGFATATHGDVTPECVLQNADFALDHAKETARGNSVRFWPGIDTRINPRLTAVREVDAALREGRIETFYQPIILLETGEIIGLEALCRMHLGGSIVPAASFHEATSNPSIATTLTDRVVSQVARDVRTWLDMGICFQHVGINISSADLHGGLIHSMLAKHFDQKGVPLKHVILEVTEMVYMDDDAGVVRKAVSDLRAKGLRIALDDFGTGYASLTHLMSVPVDIIKIDKSFVDNIATQKASAIILEGVIGIANRLGIKVVAEGIEDEEQLDRLSDVGCRLGQGFLYSPAVNASEAGQMMLDRAQGSGAYSRGGCNA